MKKIILITGSNRGIGAATALLAAREGYAVAVNYHADEAAAEAILWLVSGKSSYTTGSFIEISGGK